MKYLDKIEATTARGRASCLTVLFAYTRVWTTGVCCARLRQRACGALDHGHTKMKPNVL